MLVVSYCRRRSRITTSSGVCEVYLLAARNELHIPLLYDPNEVRVKPMRGATLGTREEMRILTTPLYLFSALFGMCGVYTYIHHSQQHSVHHHTLY